MADLHIKITPEQKRELEQYKIRAEKKLKKKLTMSKLVSGILKSFMEMSPIRED